jgi:hypothetical protein
VSALQAKIKIILYSILANKCLDLQDLAQASEPRKIVKMLRYLYFGSNLSSGNTLLTPYQYLTVEAGTVMTYKIKC